MSCGMGHMCITMGIAEAIAIRMIVTANTFAIVVLPSGRVWSGLLSNRRSVNCGDSGDSGAATARRFSFYFALKVKLAAAAAPAATVTFFVWVPAASCPAVTL